MRPSSADSYGTRLFSTWHNSNPHSSSGCLSCLVAVARTCCCLPGMAGYTPSPSAEHSLLSTRHAHQPAMDASSALETSIAPPSPPARLSARAERHLLPKGAPRSDDRGLELPEDSSAAGGGGGGGGEGVDDLKKKASMLSLCTDDDVACPTCLEPYTDENPQVTAKCGHHYHLPCIYEWLERSPTCPMCGRKMEYEELC